MTITIIANVAKSGVIGINGDLAVRIPEDLKHFKNYTTGKTCLVGPKTWAELRHLPDRVWTKITNENADRLLPAAAVSQYEFVCCGGSWLYHKAMDLADKLLISAPEVCPQVNLNDLVLLFPVINRRDWTPKARDLRTGFEIQTYIRHE